MSAKKYPRSFYDCNGRLLVACSECERGSNGTAIDKCAGASSKGECCLGILLPSIDKAKLRSLPKLIMHKTGDKKICFNGTPCRGIDKCAGWDLCQKRRS